MRPTGDSVTTRKMGLERDEGGTGAGERKGRSVKGRVEDDVGVLMAEWLGALSGEEIATNKDEEFHLLETRPAA